MFKHSSHKIPALNTTSTADISFMLLIFFLVTTSMDRDQGLKRQLPPMDDNKQEQLMDVSRDNVMQLHLDAQNRIYADDSLIGIDRLRAKVAAFVGQEQRRTMHILQVKTGLWQPMPSCASSVHARCTGVRCGNVRSSSRRPCRNTIRSGWPRLTNKTKSIVI